MATKAEKFRAEQERTSKPPKDKGPTRPRRDKPVDTAKPGVSATDRKAGAGHSARNKSERAARKAAAKLEDSETGKPSRKSTRAGKNRVKPASNLQARQTRKTASPEARARRAAANRRGT